MKSAELSFSATPSIDTYVFSSGQNAELWLGMLNLRGGCTGQNNCDLSSSLKGLENEVFLPSNILFKLVFDAKIEKFRNETMHPTN